jgi:VWFA-related protein
MFSVKINLSKNDKLISSCTPNYERLLPMKIRIAIALCMICIAPGIAQQNATRSASASRADMPVIRVSTQFVVLDALVRNKRTGNSIAGLDAKDFLLTEDRVPQSISYFTHDQLPLSVVLLFDLTETVQPVLKPLAEGARGILSHLKTQDEVSVMAFSSHTEMLQDFTTDRALATHAIEVASEMKSNEGTFIHEDVYEAIDQGMKSTIRDSRRVLVWLTDGTANFENSLTQKTIGKEAPAHLHNREEATSKLLHSGIVVAALIDKSAKTDAMVAALDISPLSFIAGARLGDISRYADMTGGPILNTNKKEVGTRLAELIDQLRERYTLGYKPLTARPSGTYCKLHLAVSGAAYKEHPDQLKGGGVLVRMRQGYYR